MKNILFCLQTMVCGGVEKELITILKKFDRTKYKLTVLLLYEQDQDIISAIPHDVQVINLNINKEYYCSGLITLVKERIKAGKFCEAIRLVLCKTFNVGSTAANYTISELPATETQYDYAVCYHMHSPIVLRYVADKIKAKHKIAWIHNDFKTTRYKIEKYTIWLEKYQKIVAASNRLGEEFINSCPEYKERVVIGHNIVDDEEIISKSKEIDNLDERFVREKRIKIVTVGRFVEQKGFDIAILACKKLLDAGIDVAWFAIGYGKDEKNMKRMIIENNLENQFFILGRKENPYPYIGKADIYVQPSRHEGFGLVIAEAKVLKRLIICTDFAGATEQIKDGVNGIIVPTCDVNAISDAIKLLINNPLLVARINEHMKIKSNDEAWKQIEGVFKDEK